MIIAHAPAGYLLHHVLPKSWTKLRYSMPVTIIGAIAPDFDLLYSILVRPGISHRYFITHTPFFWLMSWTLAYLLAPLLHIPRGWIHCFFSATLLHIILDIPTGIQILWPFRDYFSRWLPLVYYFDLPTSLGILHPYILAECLITSIAFGLWYKRRMYP